MALSKSYSRPCPVTNSLPAGASLSFLSSTPHSVPLYAKQLCLFSFNPFLNPGGWKPPYFFRVSPKWPRRLWRNANLQPRWPRCKSRLVSFSSAPFFLLEREPDLGFLLHIITDLQAFVKACIKCGCTRPARRYFFSCFVQFLFSSLLPLFT